MYEPIPQFSLSWLQIALMIATFLGGSGIVGLYNSWQKRRQPAADIHLTEANTDKVTADARLTRIDGDVQMNAIVERLHARVEQMQLRADDILMERDHWKREYDLLEIELKMAGHDIRKQARLLEDHGISYSEADKPRG